MLSDKFLHDQPPLPWQRNLTQNRQHVQEISQILSSNRSFRGWVIGWYRQFLPRDAL